MSVFTADEVERAARWTEINVPGSHYLMLDELAHRIRQDAEKEQPLFASGRSNEQA